MKTKIIISFFIIGLILSLVCGFVVGNRMLHILSIASICAICYALVGFGSYTILEQKVPEFIEFINDFDMRSGGSMDYEDEDEYLGDVEDEEEYARTSSTTTSSSDALPRVSDHKENGKFGDHILIDNIPIKNEPKLMAEAVRTFMAMDDMPASQQPPPPKQK
jgi:hypothetical protein